jgi:DNA (cytosine-5)-methyltransferase 1
MSTGKSNKLEAVDIFSGGGGLALGLRRAGFSLIGAVEIDSHAASTFQANHPDTRLFIQDVQHLKGADLLSLSKKREIDLLAGCPPCQGFTSLTAKYHKDDPRNRLLKEMLRLIEEIRPRAVMMENVPGLANRGKELLEPMIERLSKLGYEPQTEILQVADYGVPQYRKRLVLLAGKGFRIPLPKPTHSREGRNTPKWRTVREVIWEMPTPPTLSQAKTKGSFPPVSWHVVRDMTPRNMDRLRFAKPGTGWRNIPEGLRPNCHKGTYRGFSNVYGRMKWDDVSPTITGGCTTFSKGRFGHPQEDRTISVREAARLQTFPDEYVFDTPFMDRVCNIIGNALPCLFAEMLSRSCFEALSS